MVIKGKKKGEVTFVCDLAPKAKSVKLAGDFNNWQPDSQRMTKNKDGSFRTKLNLAPGRYEYKFLSDGIWLSDRDAEENVLNSYGTLNSVVCVE